MDLCVLVLVLCFFFKQKTAYEMRISDWSSDVCSSDLRAERWLRTTSPVLGDPAWAHVYEPATPDPRPTVVLCDGLFIESEMRPDPRDCMSLLVAAGFRVVRYEAPWHGRRRPEGGSGGQPAQVGRGSAGERGVEYM